eukprot:CAMPEP_0116017000 /NCGR_PEP_ID=MMETSP0321-20121206/7799_1 /TAXON_ID=163516 /ORGANISM="Leptocylindrus danicus var. danicus, Strain B650" /LENGTH=523 /DNA_ID=CAMNT_0003487133 /DNA_START=36 /DNA_END=1607 /DNA_ORIENTATION=+
MVANSLDGADENSFLIRGSDVESNNGSICTRKTSNIKTHKHSPQVITGTASVSATVTNIAKLCIGTGTLALPYAASIGGYLFYSIGLVLMCLWNLYSVDRMLKCNDMLVQYYAPKHTAAADPRGKSTERKHRRLNSYQKEFQQVDSSRLHGSAFSELLASDVEESNEEFPPPDHLSTLSKVVWFATGNIGVEIFDVIMCCLLVSIGIAYEDAILSFLESTPLTTGSRILDSLWNIAIIASLSCLPNVGFLSKFSAFGLTAIFITFAEITAYGVHEYGTNGFQSIGDEVSMGSLIPSSYSAIASWFGVAAFSFGLTPVVFNIQESMAEPSRMMEATTSGLSIASFVYILVGTGIAILYSPGFPVFEGDALEHLPTDQIQATVVRISMAFMIIVSCPLLVIPCGEILDGKFGVGTENKAMKIMIRVAICLVCVLVSTLVPDFVHVVSFIGGCFIAFISFIVPPLFYILLKRKIRKKATEASLSDSGILSPIEEEKWLLFNFLMVLVGITATGLTVYVTFCSTENR